MKSEDGMHKEVSSLFEKLLNVSIVDMDKLSNPLLEAT